MSVPLIINGITFNYPQQFDVNWGPTLTAWSTAVTNGMLQKAGGLFTLTADANFGTNFGIEALYYKSTEASIAHTGILRLANASSGIAFRNSIDSADLVLTVNASNLLTYNGVPVGPLGALLDTHIYVGNASNQPADVAMSGDIHITNTGVTTLQANTVSDSNVTAAAAITLSKLAALNPNIAVVTDGSGFMVSSATTDTEITYVHGVTSAIQTQLNNLQAQISAIPPAITGMTYDYAGTSAPAGYLPCDGAAVSRSTYSALFTAIGTIWGVGDGSTTFNVPALMRSVTVGSGGAGTGILGNTVGSTGGAETYTLLSTQVPTTTVTITDPGHTHPGSGSSGNLVTERSASGTFSPVYDISGIGPINEYSGTVVGTLGLVRGSAASNTTGISAAVAGGGLAHTIMQPSAVMLKVIKT